jgi:hypothetical protein
MNNMAPFVLTGILQAGMVIIEKLFPDPNQAAQAKLELLKLQQQGEFRQLEADLQAMQGQIDINKIEAASESTFKSGWRPATGWVCVFGFAYMALLRPLGQAVLPFWFPNIIFPPIETEILLILLGNLLGFGGFRTFERIKGKV